VPYLFSVIHKLYQKPDKVKIQKGGAIMFPFMRKKIDDRKLE
jgi:hypothetical protein